MRIYAKWLTFFVISTSFSFPSQAIEQDLPDIPSTPPENSEILHFGSEINSSYTEYTPFITPDEKYIYFESDRPGGIGRTGNYDLWFSRNKSPNAKDPLFTIPTNMGIPVNTSSFDGLPSLRRISKGDYELYFTSFSSNSRGGPLKSNIYYTRKQGDTWTIPVPVPGINTDFEDRMPSISPDGRTLYFSSNRPGGYGKDDIWMSEYDIQKKLWMEPINLGESVNTEAAEMSPSIHVDGITLYFSSNRLGGVGNYDIYVTQLLKKGKWKKPQNLGTPYNSVQDDEYPTVLKSGEYMYFASNRKGGYGGFDIYRARVPIFAKPMVIVTLKGRVHELNTVKGVEANIQVRGAFGKYDSSTGLPNGNYELEFLNNNIYELFVSSPGYENEKFILDLRNTHEAITIQKDFTLKRILFVQNALNVQFQYFDTYGNPIMALSKYKISPSMKQQKIIINNRIQIQFPKNKFKQNQFVRSNKIDLVVTASGYHNKKLEIPISALLEKQLSPGQEVVYPIEMSQTKTINIVKIRKDYELLMVVYFDTNVANKLRDSELKKLKSILNKIKNNNRTIMVHGHTDSRGSLKKNQKLSKSRAYFSKNMLIKLGIPSERLKVHWYDYSKPAVAEKDDSSRSRNRRTEIYIKKARLNDADRRIEKDNTSEIDKHSKTENNESRKRTEKPNKVSGK